MKKHLVIALTGGIGSGKSTVSRLFMEWGATVVSADELARQVVGPGSDGLREITAEFGVDLLLSDGSLNRAKLAEAVFSHPAKRQRLEAILHPMIRALWLLALKNTILSTPPHIVVYEVPLYFESGASFPEIEKVVLVTAPEQNRIARVVSRDGASPEHARARIAAQLPDAIKVAKSDFVIANDTSLVALTASAKQVFERLKESL